jgi:hypothetical protein
MLIHNFMNKRALKTKYENDTGLNKIGLPCTQTARNDKHSRYKLNQDARKYHEQSD